MISFILIFFKWAGLSVVFGMFFFFFLPTYLVIKNLDLTPIEKAFFSFFIGLGLFPTVTYYLAILVGSMRISIVLTIIILISLSLLFNWKFKKIRLRRNTN